MKAFLAITVVVFNITAGFTQSSVFLADKVTGNLYRVNENPDVAGSPFFLDEWVPGIIYLKDGYRAEKFKLKLDLYSNELLFLHEGKPLVVVNPVIEFVLNVPAGEQYLFRSGYFSVDDNTEATYYQVLQEGQVTLLKQSRKIIIIKNEYSQRSGVKEFTGSENYFIARPGKTPVKIKKDKASLVAAIGDVDGKLMAWVNKNGLRCKSEEDMKMVVKAHSEIVSNQ